MLAASSGPYPVLQLGERSEEVWQETPALFMRTEKKERPAEKPRKAVAAELDGEAEEVFQRLRALRAQLARRQGVPAYVVFSDKTLRELAVSRPRTMGELRSVSGVGDAKAGRYGKAVLEMIW